MSKRMIHTSLPSHEEVSTLPHCCTPFCSAVEQHEFFCVPVMSDRPGCVVPDIIMRGLTDE